jgi:hypothetical protein
MFFSSFSGRLIIDEIYFLPGTVKMKFLAPEQGGRNCLFLPLFKPGKNAKGDSEFGKDFRPPDRDLAGTSQGPNRDLTRAKSLSGAGQVPDISLLAAINVAKSLYL